MPKREQAIARGRLHASFDGETVRIGFVRLETRRKGVAGETWRLNGRPQIHSEGGQIQQHLQHSLGLHVASGCAEWHDCPSALENGNGGIWRSSRPFEWHD